ncbi:N-hydroxyarylamine O-acetyltransferase [Novosphingobium marinum]|uniref:N-hydroxyarylamine O-acetyltransferase n=1 Tax=Novosphingobium marinum TaxID=1514948 RepID=A0A7Y9XV42_9SPHN|nr:arylamine N-acetyltransferase [Novosphingobium marinum]NYH93945.1 N-hydroxyarylamine O-acetyltransferase [Novosphingobium marinum]GGC18482.1 N-hydroxyarylamine O-acetyltransferase [Novosphingobium marinum]
MTDDRLKAYLARIGMSSPPRPDAEGLAQIQAAQRRAIAFENLDIMLGRGIAVGSDAVFEKIVASRRGGYCFEQNRLFADMLEATGFAVRPLLARVRMGLAAGFTPPRTHTLLLVDLGGVRWIADAGFGGSYLPPLPLRDGAHAETGDGARHRLRAVGMPGTLEGEWMLERSGNPQATDGRAADTGDWQQQYSFDLSLVAPDDLEQCNHWTSTRAETRFTTLHIASIALPDGFASMVDRELTVHRGGETTKRSIADPSDYAETLDEVFNIALDDEDIAALPLFTG